MKINYNLLKTGDTFFTQSCSPIGLMIRCFTGWNLPTHVGKILISDDGIPLAVEMIGDFKKDNDLIVRPLSYYTKKRNWFVKIVGIKRSDVYNDVLKQKLFKEEIKKYRERRQDYDWKEILAFAANLFKDFFGNLFKKSKDTNKDKLICSRLVYEIDKKCGVKFDEEKQFDKLVSPADLFKTNAYTIVDFWRKGDAKKLRKFLAYKFIPREARKKQID